MTDRSTQMPLATVALIAGISLLIMVIAAPFAELFVLPKLVVAQNPAQTAKNIMANQPLFVAAIGAYLITFIGDLMVTWALYLLLKPVNENLSLLTAWFRLIFAVIALVALLNLLTVFRLLMTTDYTAVFEPKQLYAQATLCLNAFRSGFHFGIIFFAIHLVLVGYLVIKASYIPNVLGVLLIITGLGYLLTSLRPYLFPTANLDFVQYTYYGELIFMGWLLIKGSRLRQVDTQNSLKNEVSSV
ncbi:DUF4386 domain-containing protein [Spirosoma flavum]|uniref:DUF4386 domain-containing protein n=1 Tax=Spirosoma flavum TaxID=2048557 RepID=A0ABW6AI94_9BACT